MKIIAGDAPRAGDKRWYLVACGRDGVPRVVAVGPVGSEFLSPQVAVLEGVAWVIYDDPGMRSDWNSIRKVVKAPNKLSKSDQ